MPGALLVNDLARTLAVVAGDLDRRGYMYAGTVRQAARALLAVDQDEPGGCRGCGAPLPYAGRGRPRVWCGEPCRRRKRP